MTFDVQSGERVGLLGKNGAGKTTLFKILTGELDYNSGEIAFAAGKKVGLISQIPSYPAQYTVLDVLHAAFAGLDKIAREMRQLEQQMTEHTPQDILRRYDALSARYLAEGGYETQTETDKICNGLDISPAMRAQLFASLSGGEKTRVNLARLLLEKTDILLLDEPTNHLDMRSVEWLEDYIAKFRGTVLTISHDRYFVQKFAERIWELEGGHIRDFPCGYDKYRAIKAHEQAAAVPAPSAPKPKKEKPKGGAKELEKQVRAAERAVEKQEQAVAALDEQIAAAASDYQELARLMEEKTRAEDELTRLMDEWEALSLRLEDET